MNFKKYHESRNLFDGTIALQECGVDWNRYGFTITKAGTYTVSITGVVESGDFCYGRTYSNGEWSQSFYLTTGTTKNTYTASINENEKLVIFNASGSQTKAQAQAKFDRWKIMANSGSEALPYEPYSSEVWHDTPHYIHKTDTDTITTLPAVLYPTGTTATVGLKGQAVQSSTPSPTSPVMPQGCGDMTGNLWNEDYTGISSSLTYTPVYVGDGTFTLSTDASDSSRNAPLFLLSGNVTSGASTPINGVYNGVSRTTDSSNGYITIAFRTLSVTSDPSTHKTMLNTGSEPLPYEPFGVKIPISSASTTTSVYLGEVQSIRQIKKYEFTGNEDFSNSGNSLFIFNGLFNNNPYIPQAEAYCTHYSYNSAQSNISSSIQNNEFVMPKQSGSYNIGFKDTRCSNKSEFKSYLQQQYTNGTPVTIWYVLATEETAIVNEPLMKIGTYADEVSNVSIPVTAGGDTLSIDTTVQPSEVTVNYKGWHSVADVHERTNGTWT